MDSRGSRVARRQRYPPGGASRCMEKYEAAFEIESNTDALAVERLLNRLYDAVREESRTVREGTGDSTETIADFAALREAARRHAPGRLTVVYERRADEFGG